MMLVIGLCKHSRVLTHQSSLCTFWEATSLYAHCKECLIKKIIVNWYSNICTFNCVVLRTYINTSLNGELPWWLTDILYTISANQFLHKENKGSNVTCTSSPCSQLLCCTHPSICGTLPKPSPPIPTLSEMYTQA